MGNRELKSVNKREQKKIERRAEIIEVAKEVFINRGLQQVQMQEIADSANLGIATLFRYFPKKEHLVIAVANTMIQEMDEYIQKILSHEKTAFEKMEQILDYYMKISAGDFIKLIRFHDSFDLFTTLSLDELGDMTYFFEPREQLAQTILKLVAEGKEDRTIRQDLDSELLIMTIIQNFSLFGIKTATIIPELKQPTSYDSTQQLMLLKKIFLDFIKPN